MMCVPNGRQHLLYSSMDLELGADMIWCLHSIGNRSRKKNWLLQERGISAFLYIYTNITGKIYNYFTLLFVQFSTSCSAMIIKTFRT